MTRIDFYTLPENETDARWRFGARLSDRACQQGRKIYIHLLNPEAAALFDTFLWRYPADRFLAHGIVGAASARHAPILIGCVEPPAEFDDVLINLTDEVPEFFSRFERVAEIIVQQPEVRGSGRERYRYYRERGYPLHHHDMKDWRDA